MSDTEKNAMSQNNSNDKFSLNDDRRVKVLSPGAMVAKRFFRNRIAVIGLVVLAGFQGCFSCSCTGAVRACKREEADRICFR